jgi:hypothetical protein
MRQPAKAAYFGAPDKRRNLSCAPLPAGPGSRPSRCYRASRFPAYCWPQISAPDHGGPDNRGRKQAIQATSSSAIWWCRASLVCGGRAETAFEMPVLDPDGLHERLGDDRAD